MFRYLKASFQRKKARRITREYPPKIDFFDIEGIGKIEFANWDNPLIAPIKLDSSLIKFFNQFIKEGDLAIDIGANIGDTTVPMALCTGPTGLTIGFDPNPYVFKILEKNSTLNKDKFRIEPLPYAISAKEEEFYFISSEASFGNGAISPTKDSKHGKFIYPDKIRGVNLKKILEEKYSNWINKLAFIKIDAEGYDKEIIKSITGLLTQYKPAIIAESFGKSSDDEKMELYEVIEKIGYDIFYFEDFKIEAEIKKLNDKTEMTKWKDTINIYALPKK